MIIIQKYIFTKSGGFMVIDFDIKFTDDKGTKYRWEGGTVIRSSDGRFVNLNKNECNEDQILAIKANLIELLKLGE